MGLGIKGNQTPTASPEVKRRASTAGKEQRHRVSFADTSMPTSVLAQISGREISHREIFSRAREFFLRLVSIETR